MFSKHFFSLATVLFTTTAIAPVAFSVFSPQAVYAQTAQIELSVVRQNNESYEKFIERAEATAKQAINSRFAKDKSLQEVQVTVLGQNQANIMPVFSLDVSRADWRSNPNPQKWATYYANSQYLLGFDQPATPPPAQAAAPTPTPAQTPPPPPSDQTTAAPQTTAEPQTAAPQTAAPQTAAPQTAAPQTAAPQTTAEPQTTAPQTAAPQTTAEPQTTAPQTAAPQTTAEPQTTAPQTAAPQTSPPQTAAPQTSPPQTSPPGVSQTNQNINQPNNGMNQNNQNNDNGSTRRVFQGK